MNCRNKKCSAIIPDGAMYCPQCGHKQITDRRTRVRRPNGSGSVYKERGKWTASRTRGYTIADGKMTRLVDRKRGFATRADAMEYLAATVDAPQRCAQTLEQLWAAWSTSDLTKLSASKQGAYRIAHAKLLKTPIAFRRIDTLILSELQGAVDAQCSTYYTAKDMKNLLSKLYQRAMADKDATVNLARMITLPDLVEDEPIPFNDIEQQKIWRAYSDDGDMTAAAILVMIYSGMMPGELLSCKKSSIQLDSGEIVGAGKKTKKRRETPIVYPDFLGPVLRSLADQSTGEKLLTVNKDNFYAAYHALLQRIGVRDLPPYSCRHTTATALAKKDLPAQIIQKVMRHAKYTSTQRYIHQDVTDMRAAVNQLSGSNAGSNRS